MLMRSIVALSTFRRGTYTKICISITLILRVCFLLGTTPSKTLRSIVELLFFIILILRKLGLQERQFVCKKHINIVFFSLALSTEIFWELIRRHIVELLRITCFVEVP